MSEFTCPVCLGEKLKEPVKLSCGHMFCKRCIKKYYEKQKYDKVYQDPYSNSRWRWDREGNPHIEENGRSTVIRDADYIVNDSKKIKPNCPLCRKTIESWRRLISEDPKRSKDQRSTTGGGGRKPQELDPAIGQVIAENLRKSQSMNQLIVSNASGSNGLIHLPTTENDNNTSQAPRSSNKEQQQHIEPPVPTVSSLLSQDCVAITDCQPSTSVNLPESPRPVEVTGHDHGRGKSIKYSMKWSDGSISLHPKAFVESICPELLAAHQKRSRAPNTARWRAHLTENK